MPQPRKHASHAARQAAYRHRCEQERLRTQADKGLPPTPRVPEVPGTRRWETALTQAAALVVMVHKEMEQYFQERSEPWQEGERGEDFQERLDAVEQASNTLVELLA